MTRKAEAFDLGNIDTIAACNKPAEIEIKHPVTGAGTNVFFSVLGRDSDTYRNRVRAMADEALRKQATGKGSADTLESLEQKNIEALVAATVSWRTGDEPSVTVNGEKLEFSAANARRVYETLLPVRDQVSEALGDLANFMRG
jgi:hypothetical protein